MKKILFLLAILAIIGCTKDEGNHSQESVISFMNSYKSKDSIHSYAITDEYLYKQRRDDLTIVWEKPSNRPNPISIDLGYGEVKTIEYNISLVAFETDDHLYALWFAKEDEAYNYNIGIFSINGDFIINKGIGSGYLLPKLKEMPNKNIFIIIRNQSYTIINKVGNTLDYYKGALPERDNLYFIDNERYVTYDNTNISVFNLSTKIETNLDIDKYIKQSYPEEFNIPKYTILKTNIKSNYIEVELKILLYSGKSENINIKFDYNTGEYIK